MHGLRDSTEWLACSSWRRCRRAPPGTWAGARSCARAAPGRRPEVPPAPEHLPVKKPE